MLLMHLISLKCSMYLDVLQIYDSLLMREYCYIIYTVIMLSRELATTEQLI